MIFIERNWVKDFWVITSGYTSAPTVAIIGGGGSGATATAILTGNSVSALTLTNAGSGYVSPPTVYFSGGGGSGAAAAAALAPSALGGLRIASGGSGYTSSPSVSFAGGGGSGAAATAILIPAAISGLTLGSGGSGYTAPPAVTISGGGGSGATAIVTLSGNSVGSITLTCGGRGYYGTPTVAITGGGGTGASAAATLTPTKVASFILTNRGSDYTSAPTITISGGGGTGATATAAISSLIQTLSWDAENRLIGVSENGETTAYVYDGESKRVKQTVGSVTTTYVNQYYEKSGTEITTSYYLGSKLIALRKGSGSTFTLSYVMQDHLGSTSGTANISGTSTSTIRYFSFGDRLESTGNIPTDKLFTGQRLDSTGLYYYGARYYDATIGRFISADTVVSSFANPQSLNRYSYCLNNPLKYTDPSGHTVIIGGQDIGQLYANTEEYDFNAWSSYISVMNSTEFRVYDEYRQIDQNLCRELEGVENRITIICGDPGDHEALFQSFTNNTGKITLKQNFDPNSHESILNLSHEMRHAWQEFVAPPQTQTSFDTKKWNDRLYREWDAYKYQGDLDDKLSWHKYWFPFTQFQQMAQLLNVDSSYLAYYTAGNWYYNFFIGPGYGYRNYPDARTLTADDYKSR
jgi:RHS repeat-associated protein